jgi:hypothetical protein
MEKTIIEVISGAVSLYSFWWLFFFAVVGFSGLIIGMYRYANGNGDVSEEIGSFVEQIFTGKI